MRAQIGVFRSGGSGKMDPRRSLGFAVPWKAQRQTLTLGHSAGGKAPPSPPASPGFPAQLLLACSQLGGCQHFNYSSQLSMVYNSTVKQAQGNMWHL